MQTTFSLKGSSSFLTLRIGIGANSPGIWCDQPFGQVRDLAITQDVLKLDSDVPEQAAESLATLLTGRQALLLRYTVGVF
jgi:hypothetical protein